MQTRSVPGTGHPAPLNRTARAPSALKGRLTFAALLLLLILGPFFLFGQDIEQWAQAWLRHGRWIAPFVIVLLALDPLLPIPSSLISIGGAAHLGLQGGFACIWIGLLLGSAISYGLGAALARNATARPAPLDRLPRRSSWRDVWTLALSRPVPVVAEMSSIMLARSGMPVGVYMAVSTAANAVLAACYAAAGALLVNQTSLPTILIVLVGLTGVPWLISLQLRKRKQTALEPTH
ncbi:TVP38/TMEM64 family protein [Sphingomonas sp.]|uniref:TVP38/TMEM64 family protein n=1 Tax=Sphingomonas sp. TaxID=28214 RepID=UPI003B3A9F07